MRKWLGFVRDSRVSQNMAASSACVQVPITPSPSLLQSVSLGSDSVQIRLL